ncbi:MAG TPA: hypothetical protein VFC18_04195 [Burkholderiales bacterium]|nr:hypothetical protein [Burkholderiales bacterium]
MKPPGRNCPLSYRYRPGVFDRPPELAADALWIAGGLYGNPFALQALGALFEKEKGSKALVFNGDFHWFDADSALFYSVNAEVMKFHALRGNVETELVESGFDAGCGCAYPEWVDDGTVAGASPRKPSLPPRASPPPGRPSTRPGSMSSPRAIPACRSCSASETAA